MNNMPPSNFFLHRPLSPCHTWPDWTSERETDKNFCYPVMFVNIRFMSVLCSEHSFHVRWCAVCPSASVGKFCACTKIETDGNEQEYPLVVLSMSVLSCISPVIVRNSFVRCTGVIRCSVRGWNLNVYATHKPDIKRTFNGQTQDTCRIYTGHDE